jgi:uncharacterized protein (DUF427 family)
MRAIWNGAVIAESEQTVRLEGNHYFPLESVRADLVQHSATTSVCPWKGTAEYFDVVVDGKVNRDAAWVYRNPSRAARQIAGYVAFWRGVRVEAGAPEPAVR